MTDTEAQIYAKWHTPKFKYTPEDTHTDAQSTPSDRDWGSRSNSRLATQAGRADMVQIHTEATQATPALRSFIKNDANPSWNPRPVTQRESKGAPGDADWAERNPRQMKGTEAYNNRQPAKWSKPEAKD